jgi:hypothetical protein
MNFSWPADRVEVCHTGESLGLLSGQEWPPRLEAGLTAVDGAVDLDSPQQLPSFSLPVLAAAVCAWHAVGAQ